MRINAAYIVLILIAIGGCKEEDPSVLNPYDNQKPLQEDDVVNPSDTAVDPTTIQGLHKLIFAPTCANSGCHDGNFEPDFRTIESSYNTLVNQRLIKQDDSDPITYRVKPGFPDSSMLVRRLKIDLNGNSGIMPLVTEPGSDWHDRKEEYIGYIETWIKNGALNQRGEPSTSSNFPPQLRGMAVKVNGQIKGRPGYYEPVIIPAGSNAEIWVAFTDDSLPASALSNLTMMHSIRADSFDTTNKTSLQYVSNPFLANGFYQEEEEHYFKVNLSTSGYQAGDVIWLRFEASDGINTIYSPNDHSLFRAKKYAALRLQ